MADEPRRPRVLGRIARRRHAVLGPVLERVRRRTLGRRIRSSVAGGLTRASVRLLAATAIDGARMILAPALPDGAFPPESRIGVDGGICVSVGLDRSLGEERRFGREGSSAAGRGEKEKSQERAFHDRTSVTAVAFRLHASCTHLRSPSTRKMQSGTGVSLLQRWQASASRAE